MDKKTTGIIATVVSVLLCGCPGLFMLCFGVIGASAGFIPGSDIDMFGSSDRGAALITGIGALCLGVVLIIIPVVVGFLTLRNKPGPEFEPISDETIPPAI